jgi:hypothetical protein
VNRFLVYDNATGRIESVGYATDIQAQAEPGQTAINIAQANGEARDLVNNHYIENGQITKKVRADLVWSKMTIDADGVDEAVLSGLPQPTTIMVDGVSTEVTDGSLELSVTSPGEYLVVWFGTAKYFPEEWTVEGV